MTRPDHAIDAYLEGQLTDEQARAIDQWIAADPANAKAFLHLARTHQMLGIVGKENKLARETSAIKPESIDHATLASLAEMEANAETEIVTLVGELPSKKAKNPNEPTAQDYINAGRYVLRLALTSGPAKKLYAYAAVAAVVLLALVLFNPFASDAPDTVADLDFWDDIDTSTPPAVAPAITAVATLTATHNAQWDSQPAEDLRRGSKLHPNQRLTLTAGFAEITTARGAVAILQAPATIEFTHNDNALELHSGKLVGICETDASKGFLVRTPHLAITDLGTRFGINADADATEVHVFEGKVQAERVDTAPGTEPTLLVANMSARTSADTDVITRIDHDADRFATLLPETTPLPGTGFGLNVGDTDPNWQIVAIDGQPLDAPQFFSVASNRFYNGQFANDPATSQWLAFEPAEQAGDEHTYLVRTTLDLPQDLKEGARLRLTYMADNALRAVTVNGHRIVLPETSWLSGFDAFHHATIDRHLVSGTNTFVFELVNIAKRGILSDTGLRVAWELSDRSAQPDRVRPAPR